MPHEQYLTLHMHELLQYLNRVGAATFLTVAQHGMVGDMKSPVDVTYLADTVILLRYFEAFGEVRRAISILKKRTGSHENTIREYAINNNGLSVGPVLEKFQGVLRGVPEYVGDGASIRAKNWGAHRLTPHQSARSFWRRKAETRILPPTFYVKTVLSQISATICRNSWKRSLPAPAWRC
jgi:hypothetical protein